MTVELHRARPLLGTLVEIHVRARSRARAERGIARAFAAVERVHALMSFHAPDSDVSRLNHTAATHALRVHPWTFRVLRYAKELHLASGGLFEIATAPALVRGGWLPGLAAPRPLRGTTREIELTPDRRVRFLLPLLIDLGGIAKGFAVDRATDALRRAGVTAGVVNAGGDLRVFGARPEMIHLRRPEAPGTFLPLAAVRNCAVATSAHYFARRRIRGGWRVPIVNPRNGRLASEARSVTVVAPECWQADALCKCVWLAGSEARPLLAAFQATSHVSDAPLRRSRNHRHAA